MTTLARRVAVVTCIVLALDQQTSATGADISITAKEPDLSECERLFRENPFQRDSSRCFYRIAGDGSHRDAAANRLAALLAERAEENAWGILNLGNIEFLRDNPEAVNHYRRAAAIFSRAGEEENEVIARLNAVKFLTRRDRLEEAAEEVEMAFDAAQRIGDERGLRRTQLESARLLRRTGEIDAAYHLLRRVEKELFPDGDIYLQKDCLLQLAVVAGELGQWMESRELHRRYIPLAQRDNDRYVEALGLSNLALAELNRLPSELSRKNTVDALETALEAVEAIDHRGLKARILYVLGRLAGGEAGADQLWRCTELAADAGINFDHAQCLFALAALDLDIGGANAPDLIQRALALHVASDAPWEAMYGSEIRMEVAWATLDPPAALSRSQAELGMIDALRDLQRSELGKVGVLATWSAPYYWLAGRLLTGETHLTTRESLVEAFSVIESLRARLLREQLASPNAQRLLADSEGDDDHADVLLRIARANRELIDPATPATRREAVLDELTALEQRESQLVRESRSLDNAGQRIATLDEVEGTLSSRQALFAFQIALREDLYGRFAGGAWLIVSTAEGSRAYRIADRAALEPALSVYLGLLRRRDGSDGGVAGQLYDWLIADALTDLPEQVNELIIVPDGALHKLPFNALRSPDGEALCERFQISIAPSATVWASWPRSPRPYREGAALALVDPALSATGIAQAASDRQWWLGEVPGPLPRARSEGRALARRLGGRTDVVMGADANESFLKRTDLGRYDLVHLAAHAVIDDLHPQRSAVLLAPGSAKEDGLLQPRDILQLDLDGKIAVLSACRSASGRVVSGEGVMGLSRAFLRAGAHAVVGNLWPLADRDAERFFRRFYRHLGRGETLATALHSTQRELIAAGAPTGTWAGFVLQGRGDLRPFPPANGARRTWIYAAVGLTLLAAMAWWVHALGRRRIGT